ncbi:hypothetical protein LIER_31635 [Lithospermum erythrorhizon]|uniref:Uncharacterized protein n=1 Tax=Lithospermum erythrorhizon TaxID=34254 RepID=A0AAV3RVD3_LITER
MHEAFSPLLDQEIMQRMADLGLGPQASHQASQLWLQAASASCALADGHTVLSQQTQDLGEELAQERLKAQVERDVADRTTLAARRERDGLRRAYFKDRPLRCRRIAAAVLSDFVLSF